MNQELHKIEQQWRASSKISDSQLIATFPEIGGLLATQLKKILERAKLLNQGIQLKRKVVRKTTTDEFALWCYDQSLDLAYGEELRALQKQMVITKRRLNILLGVHTPGQLTDEAITHAKEQPIQQLLSEPLHSVGERLIGKCPLHHDKSPSFVIYKKTNSCWCFGCQQGGDVIKLAQLLHGYSFKEAVNYLNHN